MLFGRLRKFCSQWFHTKSNLFFRLVFFAIFLVILVAGLWPFDFKPVNKVAWLNHRNGVNFYGQGIIISSEVRDKDQKPVFPDKRISMEIWLSPLTETSNLPHILTLYDEKIPDIILVGQWKSHLVIRSRTDDLSARKAGKQYQEIGLHNVLQKNQETFITITSGEKGTSVYLNGKPAKSYPRHRLLSGYKEGPASLVLGNSPTGESYWTGNLSGLAIYNQALTPAQVRRSFQEWTDKGAPSSQERGCTALYLFDERKGTIAHDKTGNGNQLIMPDVFTPPKRILLHPPWQDFQWNRPFLQDVMINVIGFIPFGFFCSALLGKTGKHKIYIIYMAAALAGIGLSLAIEILQMYLPTRDSSLTDVICNAVGTIMGIIIFHKAFYTYE